MVWCFRNLVGDGEPGILGMEWSEWNPVSLFLESNYRMVILESKPVSDPQLPFSPDGLNNEYRMEWLPNGWMEYCLLPGDGGDISKRLMGHA